MDTLHLSQPEKKTEEENGIIVYEDEASFRQTPTLYRTWARIGSQPQIPTRGERNTQKIFGAVSLYDGRFVYRHQTEYFNAATYIDFLEAHLLPAFYRRGRRVFLIHDNASYHKKPEVHAWFRKHRKKLEVFWLPPYSPEFNAVERIWRYTRMKATHNRYFDTPDELCACLFNTFEDIQRHPENIMGYLEPFF